MEQKKSRDVTILGIVILLIGLFYAHPMRMFSLHHIAYLKDLHNLDFFPIFVSINIFHIAISITSGFALIFRKKWGRYLYIIYSLYVIMVGVITWILKIILDKGKPTPFLYWTIKELSGYCSIFIFVPLAIFFIWILTRPKIKEQFKK